MTYTQDCYDISLRPGAQRAAIYKEKLHVWYFWYKFILFLLQYRHKTGGRWGLIL